MLLLHDRAIRVTVLSNPRSVRRYQCVNLQHHVNGSVKPLPLWRTGPRLEDISEENLYTIMGMTPVDPIVLLGTVLLLEIVATLTYPLPACHSDTRGHGADSCVKESTSPGSVNLTSTPPSALDHHLKWQPRSDRALYPAWP